MIVAIILIPIYFVLTPIKIGQKLTGRCSCPNCKGAMGSTPHIFNTVTSQNHADDIGVVGLPPLPFVFDSTALLFREQIDNEKTIISNYFSEAPPLRC
jgi:hypothetical protein